MAEKKSVKKPVAAKKPAAEKTEKKEMATIYIFGKKYDVPAELTIMNAMEYAGYQLKRGCGCRNGFCGACATIYRIKGQNQLQTCLACSKKVENDMYIATLPFFPLVKQIYDINKIKPEQQIMMQLYPEIYSCVGCNACTRACPQSLQTMQYIAYAQRDNAVHRLRSARRLCKVCRPFIRLCNVRMLFITLSSRNLSPTGCRACTPLEW